MATLEREDELRIGVFVCDCGLNIAGAVDCGVLTEYSETLPDVAVSLCNRMACFRVRSLR